jgi:hypothetical protein
MMTVQPVAEDCKAVMVSAATITRNPDQSYVELPGTDTAVMKWLATVAAVPPNPMEIVAELAVVFATWMFRTIAVVEPGTV